MNRDIHRIRRTVRAGHVAALFATTVTLAASAGCQVIVGSGDYALGASISSADGSSGGGDDGTVVMTDDGGGPLDAPRGDAFGHIGDPCVTALECPHGASCQGLYCTTACSASAACGANSAGQPNLCLVSGTGGSAKSCVPSCAIQDDCSAYAGTTCTPVAGSTTTKYCAGAAPEGGPAPGGKAGDPCTVASNCNSSLNCDNQTWCSKSCASTTDTTCGTNSLGVTNHCVYDSANQYICFPGCSTNADCLGFSGTDCQPIQSGSTTISICAGSQGAVGDPCSTSSSSPWNACAAQTDGGVVPTCDNDIWCSTSCTTDTSCGTNTAGQANYCVQASGGTNICFPGCTQYADCATYTGTFCQQIYGSTRGFVCAGSGQGVGDPCATDLDCTGSATCDVGWCTQPCASASDTSCGSNSEGNTNYCVFDTASSKYQCTPGCTVSTDCLPYAGATCQSASGVSGTVCKF